MQQRETKLRQEQEAKNLSEHDVHRLRQGLEDLDRLNAAIHRTYSASKGEGHTTGAAVLFSYGVAVKEGFKHLVRQTARELVDTYSKIRENSYGLVPLGEDVVHWVLYGIGVATKYGLLALTPVEDCEEFNAMSKNVDACMEGMGQLAHYGLSTALSMAGVDRAEADKLSEFTLKAMAVRGMIPGVRHVGGTLTRSIESIVRDYEVVYNPYVYSSGAFGSLTVRRRLRAEAPLDAPTAPQSRALDIQTMEDNYFPGARVTASTVLREGAYGSKTS